MALQSLLSSSGTILICTVLASLLFTGACSSGKPDIVTGDPFGKGGSSGSGAAGTAGSGAAGSVGDASADQSSGGSSATAGAGGSKAGAAGSQAGGSSGTGWVDAADEGPAADVIFGYDAPVDDAPLTADSACAASAYEATLIPLDMYVMIDRSGSMVEPGYSWSPAGPGQISITGGDCDFVQGASPIDSKWCFSIYALVGYFESPGAAGNRVALQFYPKTGYNCASAQNNTLAVPAVQFQTLPAGNAALIDALNQADPLGAFTPTKAALHGLAGFTGSNLTPGRITIGVLVTDGVPNSCAPDDGDTLGAVADAHLVATGIKTYVIGMTGAAFPTLETIAMHGGAPVHDQHCGAGITPCHFYNVGNGDAQVFVDVLHKIQQNAIGCTYQLPTADGGIVNPSKVSVEYLAGGGGTTALGQVADLSACAGNSWYFDAQTPPNVVLCPQTCTVVQADELAKVQVLVACEGN
jgi:hypothetical protein